MKILERVGATICLIDMAYRQFLEAKIESDAFVEPFVLCMQDDEPIMIELEGFTPAHINSALSVCDNMPNGFVLAGETLIQNSKTGTNQHFFVVKLVLDGLEHSYVYSLPFLPSEPTQKLVKQPLRFTGSENNPFFQYKPMQGEASSLNALKMDDEEPYNFSTAFLIGHYDEKKLWYDTQNFIADTYCRLITDKLHWYRFIFEVSKFGKMTDTMVEEFERFNAVFEQQFAPHFPNIHGSLRLENTVLNGKD